MKKFLIASTALVALSGAAAAEVTVSGDAQIGLKYDNRLDDGMSGTVSGWNVQSRARVTFTMTGETDSGLSFGAKFRADQAGSASNRDAFQGGTIWAEGAYGKLTVGDVDSAVEAAVGDLAEVGNSGLEFQNEIVYLSTDTFKDHNNKGLLYSYKYGDATFYASFEDQYEGYSGVKYDGSSWSLGAKYSMNQYTFGIGYAAGEDFGNGEVKTVGLSASGDFNGLVVKGLYVQTKDDLYKYKQMGISADYTMANGVGVKGFYRINDFDAFPGKEKVLGLGASYDLGGGASVNGGIVHAKTTEAGLDESRTIADFGVKFSF